MSFANSGAPLNSYRPDTRLTNAIAALSAQVAALRARADILPATSGVSMGSLGACAMITMRNNRPSFEVDSGEIELTYPIGARSETLTRVTANATGVFISVYNGSTLLGGGLAAGVLILNFAAVAPQSLKIVAALAGPGSHMGDIVLSWV